MAFDKEPDFKTEGSIPHTLAKLFKDELRESDFIAGEIFDGPNGEVYLDVSGIDTSQINNVLKLVDKMKNVAESEGGKLTAKCNIIESDSDTLMQFTE